MDRNIYKVINRFECCGNVMVTVMIDKKAACVMPEKDYNRIIEIERKYRKCNGCRVA